MQQRLAVGVLSRSSALKVLSGSFQVAGPPTEVRKSAMDPWIVRGQAESLFVKLPGSHRIVKRYIREQGEAPNGKCAALAPERFAQTRSAGLRVSSPAPQEEREVCRVYRRISIELTSPPILLFGLVNIGPVIEENREIPVGARK